MDWYRYYLDEASNLHNPHIYSHRDLYLTIFVTLANSSYTKMEELHEITRAYLKYEEEINNETNQATKFKVS